MVKSKKEKTLTSPDPISFKGTEKIIDQMNNSICRIYNNGKGTGFFAKIPYKSKLLTVLITTNHIINQYDINDNKNITFYLNNDKKTKSIKLDNNRMIYTNEKLDITIIEIKENKDKLNNKFLEIDDEIINYLKLIKKDEPNYLNESIYLINYPKDKNIFVSYGKLLDINNKEIFYNSSLKEGATGSPILLINNQKLIGIHNDCCKHYNYNKGTLLIYSIIEFSKIKNNLIIINKEGKNISPKEIINSIICELNTEKDEENIRIINSYEQSNRENNYYIYKKENENEKEIKDNCEIRINGKLIPFSYFHKFKKKGKYNIIYNFKKNMTKIDYMFSGCSSLKYINLFNFDTCNVTNMSRMFYNCASLENIKYNIRLKII